mmetsp:Transcript_49524/g.99361  ORF Transcript_49524/g.99361 Transcript_49524/m.99361 type:complete len:149 (-) Transcript_49524:222-668(-)
MRLAKEIKVKAPSADFAVGSVDGVCKYTQSELGTRNSKIDNPIPAAPSSYKAYKTNLASEFSDKDHFCIFHLVGGQEVTGLALGVRAFTHETCSAETCALSNNGKDWYKQQWINLAHQTAGRDYSKASITIDPMVQHIKDCKTRFGWS